MEILINCFLSGLMAVITPVPFMLLIAMIIAFEKFSESKRQNVIYVILFVILFLVMFGGIMPGVIKSGDLGWIDSPLINVINIGKAILFGLLLAGLASKQALFNNKLYKSVLSLYGITLFALLLVLASFAVMGPILGTFMVAATTGEAINHEWEIFIGFSLGLVFPFAAVLIFMVNKYPKLHIKTWWKRVQIIGLSLFLLSALIQFFI